MDEYIQSTNKYYDFDPLSDDDEDWEGYIHRPTDEELLLRVRDNLKPVLELNNMYPAKESEIHSLGLEYSEHENHYYVYKPGATLADYWDVNAARQLYEAAGVAFPPEWFFTQPIADFFRPGFTNAEYESGKVWVLRPFLLLMWQSRMATHFKCQSAILMVVCGSLVWRRLSPLTSAASRNKPRNPVSSHAKINCRLAQHGLPVRLQHP